LLIVHKPAHLPQEADLEFNNTRTMTWALPAHEARKKLENLQREHALHDYEFLEGGLHSLVELLRDFPAFRKLPLVPVEWGLQRRQALD